MEDTVIRVSEPEELIAYIPYRLGFRPRDSVVLLGLCGPRSRLGLISRVDLADLGHPDVGARVLDEVALLMTQDGAHDVFVVLYSDLPREELGRDPVVRTALENLRRRTTWADPPWPWVVSASTFGSWGEGEQCAPATAPLTELSHSTLAATMVLHGRSVVTGREELGVLPSPHAARRRAAVRAVREAHRRYREVQGPAGEPAHRGAFLGVPPADDGKLATWREDERCRWERLVALARRGAVLPAGELGRMAVGLTDTCVRDTVLCSLVMELPPMVPSTPVVCWVLDQAMLPGGRVPDDERTEPAAAVLREIAATGSRRTGAFALGLLAWLAWWCGDGARADVLAQQALAARPGTRLAELVDQALQARVPPGWARETSDGRSPREADAIG